MEGKQARNLSVCAAIFATLTFGGGMLVGRRSAHASDVTKTCVAGPGEICPSPDFHEEIVTLKALAEKQRALSQKQDIKDLVATVDQIKGMSDRMQGEISEVLRQNPGHSWDGTKEKYVPAQIISAPPQPAPQPQVPAPKK